MKSRIILMVVLMFSLLNSCITPKDTNLLQEIKENYPKDDVAPLDYRIIQGDQLMLRIYTLDESMQKLFSAFTSNISMSGSGSQTATSGGMNESRPFNVLNVSSQGTIKIPYVGEVNVLNKTVLEAKKIISDKFKDFTHSITVDITLRNRHFFVLGELGAKTVAMPRLRITIFQALSITGNVNTFGDRKQVKIIRQTVGGTEVKVFDLRSQDIVNSDYYYIQPNDVIYIPQMQRRFFGAATSFTGIFGLVTSLVGTAFGIWALVDKIK